MKKRLLAIGLCLCAGLLAWNLLRADRGEFDFLSLQNETLGITVSLNMTSEALEAVFADSSAELLALSGSGSEKRYVCWDGGEEPKPTYFTFRENHLEAIRSFSPDFATMDGATIADKAVDLDWLHSFRRASEQRRFSRSGRELDAKSEAYVIHWMQYKDNRTWTGKYLSIYIAT